MAPSNPGGSRPPQESQVSVDDPPEADLEAALAEDAEDLSLNENTPPPFNMAGRATEAEQVRRQVDYYFSASNLQKDIFLLGKMKGRKNRPVPIKTLAKFSRMQQYQPLEFVAEALRACNSVNVLEKDGVPCVQRKEPFIMPEQLKASKTTAWEKPSAASGFESYFTEGPLPPDVAAEEAEMYNEDNTFEERIEHAIRKYLSRRKFNSLISLYFTKWMRFGGVDAQPHPHVQNTIDQSELEGLTTKEKKVATVPKPYVAGEELDSHGNPLWEVDFEGVARSFLSSVVPEVFSFEKRDQYYELSNVMQNFLRYLQYHRVCPEYNTAINATLRICDQANIELPACETLQTNLPGAFNMAASTLFGGFFAGASVLDQEWAKDEASEGIDTSFGLSRENARQLFAVGVVTMQGYQSAPKTHISSEQAFDQSVVSREEEIGLEITEIRMPTKETLGMYARFPAGFEPLGCLICKPWHPPTFFASDLPAQAKRHKIDREKTYTFLLEETILQNCRVGFKLDSVNILTLAPCGNQVLDSIPSHVRPSFYTVLENELVLKWKEPRFIPRAEQKEREARIAQGKTMPRPEVELGGGSGEASEMSADDEFD
ncbi:MAG: hypothetical protein Q9159_002376 [Coniocarpon cinnabarinum]